MTTTTIDTSVSPLLDVRTDLATAIETATGYACHPSYVEGFATPCLILTGNGWTATTPERIAYRVQVNAVYATQAGDLATGVEELARLAAVACIDAGWAVYEVPAPGTFTVGSREYAGVQFDATAQVTIREI